MQRQRRQVSPSHKTMEDMGQDEHHSAQDPQAAAFQDALPTITTSNENETTVFERKPKLHWPPASDARWKQLDIDLDNILEANLKGTSAKKMVSMVRLVYSVCKDRFGMKRK